MFQVLLLSFLFAGGAASAQDSPNELAQLQEDELAQLQEFVLFQRAATTDSLVIAEDFLQEYPQHPQIDDVRKRAEELRTRQEQNRYRPVAKEAEEKYSPCETGAGMLRQIDDWERQGDTADSQWSGKAISEEELAEIHIADCSQQLASLLRMLVDDNPFSRATVQAWEKNLDFIKWWVENRRSKRKGAGLDGKQ